MGVVGGLGGCWFVFENVSASKCAVAAATGLILTPSPAGSVGLSARPSISLASRRLGS